MSELTNNFNQQAREAEKAVLGGLMLETERFDSVILKISDNSFKANFRLFSLFPMLEPRER